LDKKQLAPLLGIVLAVGAIAGVMYYQNSVKEITRYEFFGTPLEFRADIRAAQQIPVYPNQQSVLLKVWDPDITKINITYVLTPEPSGENSMVALNLFEIRYKLDIAYRNPNFNWINDFAVVELESFDDISQTNDTLVIALVRPSLSDRTAVEMDGNVIYIKGRTAQEFDLATIKFLMSAMNITIS
jgi:hypothetical protein